MFTKLALDTAVALTCTFSNSAMLGEWTSTSIQVERRNHTYEPCEGMNLRLTCAPNNELRLEWKYRCGNWMDFHYGEAKQFPVSGQAILGQDGYLKTDELYLDGMIPKQGGTKFEIKSTGPDSARFTVSEIQDDYLPEHISRGTFKRTNGLPWEQPQQFSKDRMNGKWTGDIRIVQKDYDTGVIKSETVCPYGAWDLDFNKFFLTQTHIYSPNKCGGEDINFYVGPHYFRDKDVLTSDFYGKLVVIGTAGPNGFSVENKTSGYKIKSEEVRLEEGKLFYKATERAIIMNYVPPERRWTEFILELRRPK